MKRGALCCCATRWHRLRGREESRSLPWRVCHSCARAGTGIWVGELQRPLGCIPSSSFQVSFFEAFHCILIEPLLSSPFAKDCLSVWKRTRFVQDRSVALFEGEESNASDCEVRAAEGEENTNASKGRQRRRGRLRCLGRYSS